MNGDIVRRSEGAGGRRGGGAGWLMVELADQGYTFHTFALCDREL